MKDDLLCRTLGDHVIEGLNKIAEIEWDSFMTYVHPWEVERYLTKY